MCNACGFLCCGSDEFEGCGCDHCKVEACWSDRDPDEDDLVVDDGVDQPDVAAVHATCRVCGCTDLHACPGGCSWVAADLCSACAARALRPADRAVLGLLEAAARLGLSCPTNAALCRATGWRSGASAANALRRLERAGLIGVARFAREREVRLLPAGPRTAPARRHLHRPGPDLRHLRRPLEPGLEDAAADRRQRLCPNLHGGGGMTRPVWRPAGKDAPRGAVEAELHGMRLLVHPCVKGSRSFYGKIGLAYVGAWGDFDAAKLGVETRALARALTGNRTA